MMAITPMPPTISAIEEITTRARTIARVKFSRNFRTLSAVIMSKSFGSSSRSRCRARMIRSISAFRSACDTPSAADTTMVNGRQR